MIEEIGGEVVVASGDICDPKTIDALATEVVAKFGQIDWAGEQCRHRDGEVGTDHSKQDFDKVLDVTLVLPARPRPSAWFRNAQAQPGFGRNIASVGAKSRSPTLPTYRASKAAVVGRRRGWPSTLRRRSA